MTALPPRWNRASRCSNFLPHSRGPRFFIAARVSPRHWGRQYRVYNLIQIVSSVDGIFACDLLDFHLVDPCYPCSCTDLEKKYTDCVFCEELHHFTCQGKNQYVLPQSSGRPTFFLRINEISFRITSWRLRIISWYDFLPYFLSGSKYKVS